MIVILFLLGLIVGMVVLQIRLLEKSEKLGLILPTATLIIATFATFILLFNLGVTASTHTIEQTQYDEGYVIERIDAEEISNVFEFSVWSVILRLSMFFLVCNIPTVILITLYICARNKKKTKLNAEI